VTAAVDIAAETKPTAVTFPFAVTATIEPLIPDVPSEDDVQPVLHETRDRIITGTVTVVPILGLLLVGWQMWGHGLGWNDVFVFLIMYFATALGITVGFHRLFTHRAFKAKPWVRGMFAIFGSAAIEGPVISWVADHRKHHAFSDREGDPHSPHVGHEGGWHGALKGLAHAHVGWLFIHTHRGRKERYAPDLLKDPLIRWVDRTFVLWVAVGLALPFGLGFAFGGRLMDGFTGMLWGGLVRILLLHHVTYSINSLCHFFGKRTFETGDESRNLAWLAPLSMGEAWHNGHHAFPTSARHGLQRFQLDISAGVITALEKLGLAWDVIRIEPAKIDAKRRA
jgi:stearoyl-CoA desaturase (delta-9 desaturase)